MKKKVLGALGFVFFASMLSAQTSPKLTDKPKPKSEVINESTLTPGQKQVLAKMRKNKAEKAKKGAETTTPPKQNSSKKTNSNLEKKMHEHRLLKKSE